MQNLKLARKETASFLPEQLVVVPVDVQMFSGSPYILKNHNSDPMMVKNLHGRTYARETITLLLTLQEIMNRPYLGTHDPQDFKTTFMVNDKPRCMVEQFVERVKDSNDTLLGFRFYYMSCHPGFSWDLAINKILQENKACKQSLEKMGEVDQFVRRIKNKYDWVFYIIGAWKDDGSVDYDLITSMMNSEFENFGEASVTKRFSFAKAMEFFENSEMPQIVMCGGLEEAVVDKIKKKEKKITKWETSLNNAHIEAMRDGMMMIEDLFSHIAPINMTAEQEEELLLHREKMYRALQNQDKDKKKKKRQETPVSSPEDEDSVALGKSEDKDDDEEEELDDHKQATADSQGKEDVVSEEQTQKRKSRVVTDDDDDEDHKEEEEGISEDKGDQEGNSNALFDKDEQEKLPATQTQSAEKDEANPFIEQVEVEDDVEGGFDEEEDDGKPDEYDETDPFINASEHVQDGEMGEDDSFEIQDSIRKPYQRLVFVVNQFYYICPITRDPYGFYNTVLFHQNVDPNIEAMTYRELYHTYENHVQRTGSTIKPKCLIDTLKPIIERLINENVRRLLMDENRLASTYNARASDEIIMYLKTYLQSESIAAGLKACFQHIEDRQLQARLNGTQWSAAHFQTDAEGKFIDLAEDLSDFGNCMAKMMFGFEYYLGYDYLHLEQLESYLLSMHALYIRPHLQGHTINTGPPSSGKSRLLEILQKMLPRNAYMPLSYITQKGWTMTVNMDGLTVGMDEGANEVTEMGKNGQGDPIVKTMLTGGDVTTMMATVNSEDRKREAKISESRLRFRLEMNVNCSRIKVAPPIVDRCIVRTVPYRTRNGVDLLNGLRSDGNEKLRDGEKQFYDFCQDRFALAGMLESMINLGIIRDVNSDYAKALVNKVFAQMEASGVSVQRRRVEHVVMAVRECAVTYALYMVFCTPKYCENPDDPFDMKTLLHCAKYMQPTEEMVYFAVTMMTDSLILGPTAFVARAFKSMVDRNVLKKYEDDNYYVLPITSMDSNLVLTRAKDAIFNEMVTVGGTLYSLENVLDVLFEYSKRIVRDENLKKRLSIVQVSGTNITGEYLLKMLKSFVDNYVEDVNSNPVIKAVQSVAPEKTRFLIGETYRVYNWEKPNEERNDFMFPHVLRSVYGLGKVTDIYRIKHEYTPKGLQVMQRVDKKVDVNGIHEKIMLDASDYYEQDIELSRKYKTSFIFSSYDSEMIAQSLRECRVQLHQNDTKSSSTTTTTVPTGAAPSETNVQNAPKVKSFTKVSRNPLFYTSEKKRHKNVEKN